MASGPINHCGLLLNINKNFVRSIHFIYKSHNNRISLFLDLLVIGLQRLFFIFAILLLYPVEKEWCVNYLILKDNSCSFLWILTVILAGTAAVQLNLSKWRQYQENPTVVSLERNYLDWNTSLPAVSICPEAKLNPSKLEKVIKKFSYVKNEKGLKNFLLSLVFASYKNFDVFMETFDELKTSDYWKAVAMVKHDLTYTVINSNAEYYDITIMPPFMSESGICYSYNSVVTQYNDPSYWETRNWSIVEAPAAFKGSPLDGDIFAQIMSMNTGYRLYIHAPAEFPDVALSSMVAKNNSFKELEIQALNIYSTEATLQLSIKQRKCRRPEESNLLLSPIYTYNMCRMECRMKKCWELCGCIPYFYRPLEKFKICDIEGMKCLSKHKELLVKLRDPKTEKKIQCDCLPQCDEINYLIDSESTMNWDFGTTLKWGVIRYPRLRYKRDIIFGLSDLLVAIGGTAGLFLGCSLLSFAEIFYFFSLRLFWFIVRKMRKN